MLNRPQAVRKHGFQFPLSPWQIAAIAAYLTLSVLALVTYGLYASSSTIGICYGVYCALMFILLIAYLYCSLADVSKPGGIGCMCMRKTQRAPPKYCRLCNKVIPGLDHHCNWLNTCVGTRTYFAFYILITVGLCQFIIQIVFGALIAGNVWNRDDKPLAGQIFSGIVGGLGIFGVLAFAALWVFHTYLLTQGIGTVDYLMQRDSQLEPQPQRRPPPVLQPPVSASSSAHPLSTYRSANVNPQMSHPPASKQGDLRRPTAESTDFEEILAQSNAQLAKAQYSASSRRTKVNSVGASEVIRSDKSIDTGVELGTLSGEQIADGLTHLPASSLTDIGVAPTPQNSARSSTFSRADLHSNSQSDLHVSFDASPTDRSIGLEEAVGLNNKIVHGNIHSK